MQIGEIESSTVIRHILQFTKADVRETSPTQPLVYVIKVCVTFAFVFKSKSSTTHQKAVSNS